MTHIQQRRDQSAVWTAVNPVLLDGEVGWESDTGKAKMGDGETAWADLTYLRGVDSVAGKTGAVTLAVGDVAGAAPLASPVFTGNPTAPTPPTADNDTSIATTAYVKAQGYIVPDSPVFTGNPTAPTPDISDNDTSIATTKFVKDVVGGVGLWQSYTPQFVNWINGPSGTAVGRYTEIGKTVFFRARITLGSGFVISGTPMIGAPSPFATTGVPNLGQFNVLLTDSGVNVFLGVGIPGTASAVALYVLGGNGALGAINSAYPFPITAGDVLEVSGVYERT